VTLCTIIDVITIVMSRHYYLYRIVPRIYGAKVAKVTTGGVSEASILWDQSKTRILQLKHLCVTRVLI